MAIDGSDSATHALRCAKALLPGDVTLVLATVVAPPVDPNEGAGGFAGPTMTPEDAEHQHAANVVAADAALAEAARALGPEPVEQRVLVARSAADAIAQLAAELAIDLVVIGSHDHGVVSRALLDPVGDAILRASPVPVLIVPSPHD